MNRPDFPLPDSFSLSIPRFKITQDLKNLNKSYKPFWLWAIISLINKQQYKKDYIGRLSYTRETVRIFPDKTTALSNYASYGPSSLTPFEPASEAGWAFAKQISSSVAKSINSAATSGSIVIPIRTKSSPRVFYRILMPEKLIFSINLETENRIPVQPCPIQNTSVFCL